MSTTNRCDNIFVKNGVECNTIGCKQLYMYKLKNEVREKQEQPQNATLIQIDPNAPPYVQEQQRIQLQRQIKTYQHIVSTPNSNKVQYKGKPEDYEKVDIYKELTEKYDSLQNSIEELRSMESSSTNESSVVPQEVTDEIEKLKLENETLKRTIEGFETRLTALSNAQAKVPKVGPKGPKGDSIKKMSQLTDVDFDPSKIEHDCFLVYNKKLKKFIAQSLVGED